MLIKSTSTLVLVIVGFFLFVGCKKTAGTSSQPGGNSFTWTYMGTNYSAKENEASVYSLGPYTVVAGMDRNSIGINRRLLFTLSSFNTGTYSIRGGNNNNNNFEYVDDSGNELLGKSGTVTITANSNNLLSGNFSCTLLGPSNTTSLITGSFTNVPVK